MGAALLSLALASALGCNRIQAQLEPLPSGPSVLLVTIDTLRADHVGAYGAETRTPTLDALAAEGTTFDEAMATVPLTLPSHTSILTGLYPPHHGVRHNAVFRLDAKTETIAERFQAAGYATGAVIGADVLSHSFGLAQGFDQYDDRVDGARAGEAGFAERKATAVTDAALAWLTQEPRPFFLWVHYYDVHGKYDPPEPYRSQAGKNLYDGEVAYVDHELGRLLDGLRAANRLSHTVVAVTADHGEGLGEHGEPSHSYLIYDSVLHVPLILKGPGVPQGARVAKVVSNAALAPTLLALAGLPPLPKLDVADLAPVWKGQDREPGWAYAETLAGQLDFGWAPIYAIRGEHEKWIQAPRPEWYDLAQDPHELRDLLASGDAPPEGVAAAKGRLASVRSGEQEIATREVDAETRARIEALGYAIPGAGAPAGDLAGADPKDVHRQARLGVEALSAYFEKRYADTERIALAGLQAMPRSVQLNEILARLYLETGRWPQAIPYAEATVRYLPSWPGHHVQLGLAYLGTGDTERAVPCFDEALRLDPDNVGGHLGSMWRAKLGMPVEEAAEHAARALALAPDDPLVADTVGETWETLGQYDRALEVYEGSRARFPKDARVHMRLAIQYARFGDAERSTAELKAAGTLAQDARLAARLGIVYAARGEYARAEPIFRGILEREPRSRVRLYLARLLRETGRAPEAEALMAAPGESAAPAPLLDGLLPQASPRG
jgi:arylsulfatase A-like enzyme/tetratricopeptide (TPR) repeat protein